MEVQALKQSMAEMSETIHKRLLEFQQDLQKTTTTVSLASPPTRLASDFNAFRTFVITSLQCLQAQVDGLSKICDTQEMRSRRKFLMLHGVPEVNNENTSGVVLNVFSTHLKVAGLSEECLSRCHRLGPLSESKVRPILVKVRDLRNKDKIWSSKTKLRGSGITLSEFLTKHRHDLFMTARSRFGISKCWTNGGRIYVIGADGTRHLVEAIGDLNSIPAESTTKNTGSSASSNIPSKDTKAVPRTKRPIRNK